MDFDIFNFKKVKDLQSKVSDLEQNIEAKGYYGGNETNEYLKALYSHFPSFKLIDFGDTNFRNYIQYYQTNAIVNGIVGTTIGNAVSELAKYIELVNEKDELVENHWAWTLLQKPNDLFSLAAYLKSWAIMLNLTGNAFQYKEKNLGSKFSVKGLYLMPTDIVQIISEGSIAPIKGYKIMQSVGLKENFTPAEVIFSKMYNPDYNSYYGLSPLKAAASYVQLLETGQKRQNTAMQSGGVGRLITPKPSEYGINTQDIDKLDKELNGKHLGNYTKTIGIPIETHILGDTPVDLNILQSSEYSIKALCFVYGISVDTFLGQAKYENTKEAKKAVYQQSAIPLVNTFLEDLNHDFSKESIEFGSGKLKFILNTDKIEILRDSPADIMNALVLANASINDKLEFLGYPKRAEAWADLPMVPLGYSFGNPDDLTINENI